jgi:hypothetical protein
LTLVTCFYHFLALHEFVLRLLSSNDDLLRLSALFSNDNGSRRCRLPDDDGLWLCEIFRALAVFLDIVGLLAWW